MKFKPDVIPAKISNLKSGTAYMIRAVVGQKPTLPTEV